MHAHEGHDGHSHGGGVPEGLTGLVLVRWLAGLPLLPLNGLWLALWRACLCCLYHPFFSPLGGWGAPPMCVHRLLRPVLHLYANLCLGWHQTLRDVSCSARLQIRVLIKSASGSQRCPAALCPLLPSHAQAGGGLPSDASHRLPAAQGGGRALPGAPRPSPSPHPPKWWWQRQVLLPRKAAAAAAVAPSG